MYKIIYAADYHLNDYRIIEDEIEKISMKEFEKKCKEIYKEYHPVRFVILESDDKGIVAVYRNKRLTFNLLWKTKKEKKK